MIGRELVRTVLTGRTHVAGIITGTHWVVKGTVRDAHTDLSSGTRSMSSKTTLTP